MNAIAILTSLCILLGALIRLPFWEKEAVAATKRFNEIAQAPDVQSLLDRYGPIVEKADVVRGARRLYFSGTTVRPVGRWAEVEVRYGLEDDQGRSWTERLTWDVHKKEPRLIQFEIVPRPGWPGIT